MSSGVVIIKEDIESYIDMGALVRTGYRTRVSKTCVPDLIFTRNGKTLAVITWKLHSGHPESNTRVIISVANTFRQTLWVLPFSFMGNPQVIASYCRFPDRLTCVFLRPGESITSKVLTYMEETMSSGGGGGHMGDQLVNQRYQSIRAPQALHHTLSSIPGVNLTPAQVASLTIFGSLEKLSQCLSDDIQSCTSCTEEQAKAIEQFWNL